MITGWEIYWITRLDAICMFLVIGGTCAVICSPLVSMALDDFFDVEREKRMRIAATTFFAGIAFLAASVLIPTTNQAVAIYMVPKIANNEQMQKLPDNAMKFLNTKFEAWIDETLKEKKK